MAGTAKGSRRFIRASSRAARFASLSGTNAWSMSLGTASLHGEEIQHLYALISKPVSGAKKGRVTVEQVIAVVQQNAENASKVLRQAVATLPKARGCKCESALAHAIMTEPAKIPAITREKLKLLLDKYLNTKKAGE